MMRPMISLELRLGLLGGDLAALGELADLALSDVPRLVEARLDERVVDVLQHHRDAGGGDCLGDLAAHCPCSHDCGLEDEHALHSSDGWVAAA